MRAAFSDLDRNFGSDNVSKMAAAYEGALRDLMAGSLIDVVDRKVRLSIVTCLIAEARNGQFDPDILKARALSAARRLASAVDTEGPAAPRSPSLSFSVCPI